MNQEGEKVCRECGYFRQHFVWRAMYMETNCGHCVHPPRTRRCRPDMGACPKWIPQDEAYRALYGGRE